MSNKAKHIIYRYMRKMLKEKLGKAHGNFLFKLLQEKKKFVYKKVTKLKL